MDESKLTELLESLEAALQVFKGSTSNGTTAAALPPSAAAQPSKEQLHALLERARTDISKVGIMFGDGVAPSGPESLGLAEAVVQSCLGVVMLLHAMTAGAGPSLKELLAKSATALVGPTTDLLKAMAQTGQGRGAGAGGSTAATLKAAVGHCWGAIDACKAVPLDNKGSIFKNITTVLLSMKDVIREMTELQEESSRLADIEEDEGEAGAHADANGHAHGHSNGHSAAGGQAAAGTQGEGEEEDDGLEDMVDFEAGQVSAVEAQTLGAARQLVEAAGKVLRAVSKPLLRGPAVNADTGLEAWENVLWHARALQKCCEDLGAAMYPPQDNEEVRGSAEGVFNSSTLLLAEIPEDYAEQLKDEAATLEQQLEAANEQLLAALQAAEEQ